jgi:hypothetical protein
MVELLVWTLVGWAILFALCAFFRGVLGPRWKAVAAAAVVPAVLVALVLVFLAPPIGGYDPMAARYWMSRAAADPDSAAKEAHVRRVVFASPEHGWFTASEAIGTVEDRTQRCRLRTILAGLRGVRNRERLGREARDECNAPLMKGDS